MDTTIGTDANLEKMRKERTQQLAVALQQKMTTAMLNVARDGGIVPTPQLKEMCSTFAAVAANTVMQEFAVVQTRLVLRQDDLPPGLREATTQEIINEHVKPALVADIANAMMSAGLAAPTLAIPPQMGADPIFASWSYVLREQSGPAAMPNAPRLEYGRGTTVIPRAALPSAEAKPPKPAASFDLLKPGALSSARIIPGGDR